MQKTSKLISQQVFNSHPEYSLEMIEKLNTFIFVKLKEKIKEGDSLIYFLPPLGNFVFRLKETDGFLKLQGYKKEEHKDGELINLSNKILDKYKIYKQDKLNVKYERFGKESHEAYILAKKQEKLQRREKIKSK